MATLTKKEQAWLNELQEVLEAAKDSPEFEELMDAYRREAMAIIARWDLADQLDGQRDAA
jgi:F0F1-type ATP synthase delta subunit